MTAISVIATLMAIGATVCAFIFVVPEKNGKRKKIMQILHDLVNFKTLIIEKVLQATYIFATAFCVISGFCMLFWFETYRYSYYGSRHTQWHGLEGILLMVVGPIAVRLAYEVLLMAIIAVKNIIQINSKLKNQNGGEVADAFAMPKIEKTVKADEPKFTTSFCTACGSRLGEDGICPNCGK